MNRFKISHLVMVVALVVVLATGANAARFEDLVVGKLTVKKSANIQGLIKSAMQTTGNIFYVDSNGGINGIGERGKSADKPLDSVDYAIGRCTANNGDVIVVMPGHAESFTAADGFDADVAGITVVGLGSGADMPEFTFAGTAATVAVGAANVMFVNLRFIAGISDIVMGISIEADGDDFTMVGCEFPKPTTNSFEFLDAIDVADGSNGITIKNCVYFNDEGGAAANHFIDAGNGTAGPERLRMIGNYIKGDFAVAAIWSDEPCDEVFISNNVVINHTTGEHAIEFSDTGTGAIVNNVLYGDTESAILDPGSHYIAGNKICTAIDKDGIPRWILDNGLDHLLQLDGATQIYPENAVDDSILAKILTKSDPADISDYDNSTDSLEAMADAIISLDAQINVTEATGDADIDISEADYTGYTNILTVTAAAGGLMDLRIDVDVNKATTGWDTISTAADTIDITLVGQVDGTNYRTIQNATQITANGDGSLENNESGVSFHVGPLGPNESLQVHVKLSVERDDAELPYRVAYTGAAPTITPVAIP